ncbi:putative tyramine receptor 2 [Calliphora vicina]|uniref:putative tyramine receptor 2 n=1 Tax=Calliphora vicina TaxID=7373 RepID=UPI00325AD353
MTIQQQKPQLLSLLYETIKATTTAAVTTSIQTTKATLINNYNYESDSNLTATTTSTTKTTTTTTTIYELLHMSTNTTAAAAATTATTTTTTTANLLPKSAFRYATSTPLNTASATTSSAASPATAYLWENAPLSSATTTTSLVVDLVESLASLENLTNSLASSIETSPLPLNGNFSWDATATATTITISTRTSSNVATLPPFVDSYLVGMAWSKALVVAIFMLLILVTVVGNTLVILAVLTTRRLRTVTNCFVLNLAITDWLVGTCVMPPAVIHYIAEGVWRFGWILCDIWISLDVLLCTASILSLCAISLDRYLAVTQPLTYSKNRRTKRLALFMIFIVWVTALSITCPPYLGWYEPGRRDEGYTVCRYNQNKGYVVFSAMGSFFIPLAVMLYVYLKIGYVLTSRRQRIVRDANSERTADHEIDCDNFLSESEHFHCGPQNFPSFKSRWTLEGSASAGNSKTNSLKCSKCNKNYIDQTTLKHQASFYELVEISRLSVQTSVLPPVATCTSINCRYGDGTCTPTAAATTNVTFTIGDSLGQRGSSLPIQQLHCTDSRTSFSETCLAQAMTQIGKYATNGQHQQQLHLNNVQHHGHHPVHSQQQQQHHHHHQHHPQHGHHHHHHRVPMRVSTTKRDTKTAKTLTMVMGGFIACWLPFFVYYILIPFLPPAAVSEGLMSFLTWVGWVNCAINPFIYAFYNPDFRTAFWRLTCKRICKQKSPANHATMFRG